MRYPISDVGHVDYGLMVRYDQNLSTELSVLYDNMLLALQGL